LKAVWVLCGGISSEHAISILSARNVVQVLSRSYDDVAVLYVARNATWHAITTADFLQLGPEQALAAGKATALVLFPGSDAVLRSAEDVYQRFACDVVFSVIHGQQGEDGVVQGLLNCLQLPFVGSDVLGSSICMAKHVAKALLHQAGIQTTPGVVVTPDTRSEYMYENLQQRFGATLFIKPSASGSSIGVSRVTDATSYADALATAFTYDHHVLVEQAIVGREIECSVLGNTQLAVSLPGEIILKQGFYDYAAKYVDADTAVVQAPADLPQELIQNIQALAKQVFITLQCKGLARIDLFVTDLGEIFVNEVNTMPGFTDISMYAKNWQVSGIAVDDLLQQLIQLACDDFSCKQQKYQAFVSMVETKG
jgi:D-alanine-D-alanine ligase